MDMPHYSAQTLGIGEYQIMEEELDRECIPADFGFGWAFDKEKEVAAINLRRPLKDRAKYVGADVDSKWGILQDHGRVDAIYLELEFYTNTRGERQDIGKIRIKFSDFTSQFMKWLRLIIETNGDMMLDDSKTTGSFVVVEAIGVTGIPLDIPNLITKLATVETARP